MTVDAFIGQFHLFKTPLRRGFAYSNSGEKDE